MTGDLALRADEVANPSLQLGVRKRAHFGLLNRLPRFIQEQATVAHKTGEMPPYVLNDAGIIVHEGGPTVVSVFVNENQGTVLEVEETIGRIAEDLIRAWGS